MFRTPPWLVRRKGDPIGKHQRELNCQCANLDDNSGSPLIASHHRTTGRKGDDDCTVEAHGGQYTAAACGHRNSKARPVIPSHVRSPWSVPLFGSVPVPWLFKKSWKAIWSQNHSSVISKFRTWFNVIGVLMAWFVTVCCRKFESWRIRETLHLFLETCSKDELHILPWLLQKSKFLQVSCIRFMQISIVIIELILALQPYESTSIENFI
jgi:hypothetical protein